MEPTCAYCRRKKERPHQVFLNFSEATIDENASNVADGLDRIDANSPAVSLERAGRKIRDITKYVHEDNAVSSRCHSNCFLPLQLGASRHI
jgi:hypothetical protein